MSSLSRSSQARSSQARSFLSPRFGLLQVCLAGVLWGTGGLAVQLIRQTDPLSALTLSAWRLAIAAVAMLAGAALLRRAGDVARLLRRSPGRVTIVALGTAGYQFLYFSAVTHVGVTVATMVSLGLAPVVLYALPGGRHRRRPTPLDLAVLATAVTGLVLVSLSTGAGGPAGTAPVLGVVEACASGLTYAVTTLLGRRLSGTADPVVVSAATCVIGATALVPSAVAFGGALLPTHPGAWAWLAYLGVLTMALAYTLFYAGLRTTAASSAAIATLLEPVTAAVVAAAVLHERLGATGVLGSILVLVAVAGLSRIESAQEGPAQERPAQERPAREEDRPGLRLTS